jgi:hypothetical protein
LGVAWVEFAVSQAVLFGAGPLSAGGAE